MCGLYRSCSASVRLDTDATFRWYDFRRNSVCALIVYKLRAWYKCRQRGKYAVTQFSVITLFRKCKYPIVTGLSLWLPPPRDPMSLWDALGITCHMASYRPVSSRFYVEWLICYVVWCGVEQWGWMCFVYNWRGSLSSDETKIRWAWLIDLKTGLIRTDVV